MSTTTATNALEIPLIRRVSWGALFAGFFVGMGVWLMLLLLIAGIGFSSVHPRNLGSWMDVLQGIGIWGGIAGIVAMFVGGWCAGRLCGTAERSEGALHGATVWGIGLAACAWIAMSMVSTALNSAAAVAGQAADAVGALAPAVGSPSQDQLARAATAAVNGYLRDAGKEPLPQQQVEAAASDIASRAMQRVQQGNFAQAIDRQTVTSILARDTNLSSQDADALADRLTRQLGEVVGQAGQTAQGAARQVGRAAASGGRAAAWGGFVFAALTLVAAVAGGALAITGDQRRRLTARQDQVRASPLRPQEA